MSSAKDFDAQVGCFRGEPLLAASMRICGSSRASGDVDGVRSDEMRQWHGKDLNDFISREKKGVERKRWPCGVGGRESRVDRGRTRLARRVNKALESIEKAKEVVVNFSA